MSGFVTRGQPAALRQVRAMLAAGLPHALLVVGPNGVGKTTLALDIAAAQLCTTEDALDRPCRACRACRLVGASGHPDVHRLVPEGAGAVIGIDAVRNLISELSLLASEGGARLAIVESAHRMTEDAQNALLKTLEEPPAGVTLILCAEDEDRLLPTIHSRVARIRVGTLAPRDIEELLEGRGEADAPTANRLARLAGGRPGLAIAYARAPDAVVIRAELSRSLLDLADAPRALRLVRIRELLGRSSDLIAALTPAAPDDAPVRATRGRGRGSSRAPAGAAANMPAAASSAVESSDGMQPGADEPVAPGKATPSDRRRAAGVLLELWRDTARDLALVQMGEVTTLHDPGLLEDLRALAARIPAGGIGGFLVRLARANQLLDANANPELAVDVLALVWPAAERVA